MYMLLRSVHQMTKLAASGQVGRVLVALNTRPSGRLGGWKREGSGCSLPTSDARWQAREGATAVGLMAASGWPDGNGSVLPVVILPFPGLERLRAAGL